MNNCVGLQRITIQSLDPTLSNVLIVGVIIGKQRPRTFTSQSDDGVRAVWNFTLRDSVQHYINVSFWGPMENVFQANDKFKTGDVVQICNPVITIRNINDKSEQFHPMVTSPYKLSMNEKSDILLYPTEPGILKLLQYPTKLTATYVPIVNIHNGGDSFKFNFVDVLGAVRGLGPIRTITTKYNELAQVREVEVFDHTSPSLRITIWEPDIIQRSNCWKPRATILFFTDVKVDWSAFDNSYVVKVTGRTIVTENPITREAIVLREYAENAPIETFDIVDQLVQSLNIALIKDVMSVKQVQDRINMKLQNHQDDRKHFTALLYVIVTTLDLDGLSKTLIVKCGRCKSTLSVSKCENPDCPVVFENECIEPEVTFDIKVLLTDHTGTLTSCRLSGQTAEKILNCTASTFSEMSDDEKCALKWKFLLQRCAVRLGVFFMIRRKPLISILSMDLADMSEVARSLPVY